MLAPENLPDTPSEDVAVPAEQDAAESAASGLVAYKVVCRARVDEVKKGGVLHLDPDEPRTARLLARGQIVRVETQED